MAGAETAEEAETVHATTVALDGRGVLIRGAAGTGKSALALALLAQGAQLVADDRTLVWRNGDAVMADAPRAIRGLIEARGVGILGMPPAGPVALDLVVTMDRAEPDRLPPFREATVLGRALPELWNPGTGHFPAAVLLYLRHERRA